MHRLVVLAGSVLVCLSCGWLGVQAATPFRTAARWRAANDELERAVRRCRIHNQRDALEIEMLNTPEGIEQAARKLGYVAPGEHPLRLSSQ